MSAYDPNRAPSTPDEIRLSALLCDREAHLFDGLREPGDVYPFSHYRHEDSEQIVVVAVVEPFWPAFSRGFRREAFGFLGGFSMGIFATLFGLWLVMR